MRLNQRPLVCPEQRAPVRPDQRALIRHRKNQRIVMQTCKKNISHFFFQNSHGCRLINLITHHLRVFGFATVATLRPLWYKHGLIVPTSKNPATRGLPQPARTSPPQSANTCPRQSMNTVPPQSSSIGAPQPATAGMPRAASTGPPRPASINPA